MEAAHRFMLQARDYPVAECGEPLEPLLDAASEAGVDLGFAGTLHASRGPRLFLLRASLVRDLLGVAETMSSRGCRLILEDGFRTREMQAALARSDDLCKQVVKRAIWELSGGQPSLDLIVRRLGAMVAPSPKVGTHMSGSAVDVSVVDRRSGVELDRGGRYLEISERTPMGSPFVPTRCRRVRETVTELMAEHGFVAYPYEFWHYSKGDAFEEFLRSTGRPARFGPIDLNPASGAVTPIANPTAPLNKPAELEALLAQRLAHPASSDT
jgi:D-alanyl-D-alanine dipeptidase